MVSAISMTLRESMLPLDAIMVKNYYILLRKVNNFKIIDQIATQVDDTHEIPVTCVQYWIHYFRWRPMTHTQTKVIGVGNSEGHF